MKITRLDHLVLTVRDIQKSCAFSTQIPGMEHVTFEGDRQALIFGVFLHNRINWGGRTYG